MTNSSNDRREIRNEFQMLAYMIVHQLKEPTRAIRTGVEMLVEGDSSEEADSELKATCIDRILRGTNRLDDITDSIAQLADDLGNEDEEMEEINTGATFRAVKQKLGRLIEQSSATVSNAPMPTLRCQPARFARVLEHLLRNALVYRSERPLHVSVTAEEHEQGWKFSVADNGIGIPKNELPRIFEPFYRLNSKGYKGLGMGLTTSKRIIERHGGQIWAESDQTSGSTIFFTLPK